MISPINPNFLASPAIDPSKNRPSYSHLLELLGNQEKVIQTQNFQIQKIQKELKELKIADKKKRQKQLFQLFKNKYELECKNRSDFEKQIQKYIRKIQCKIISIDKTLYKCMASQSTEISLPASITNSICQPKFLFSSQFSDIPQSPNALFKTNLEVGQVTNIDSAATLAQIDNKLEHLDAITQIVFLRLDKYVLEHRNIQKLINGQKRILETQIQSLKKQLKNQIHEKQKIKKILQSAENERVKWVDTINKIKQNKDTIKLMNLDKQKLVEQLIKMMICINTLKKQKEQKQLELRNFKQEQKGRYNKFLEKIRDQKQMMLKIKQ